MENLQAFVGAELKRMEIEREAAINEFRHAAFMDEHPAVRRELVAMRLLERHSKTKVDAIIRLSGRLNDTFETKLSREAKGQLPFIEALPVGETQFVLFPAIPGDYDGGGGNIKKLFTVSYLHNDLDENGKQKKRSWPVNPRSPSYRDVLMLLPKAIPNGFKIAVVRTGKDKTDTRYSLRELGPA